MLHGCKYMYIASLSAALFFNIDGMHCSDTCSVLADL